jgi:NAD(P)-dependent dehydrogenase (short-subunit alcohol dehydrogenase family)
LNIEGSVALVTGANRGIGRAIARALLEHGAKVYAGARNPSSITDPELIPVKLDITDAADVAAAAALCDDTSIVINNAGIATGTSPLSGATLDEARRELEVNYLGPLAVSRAFAPVLAANGGGALVNVLSVMSWIALPQAGTYAAAKAAAWSMTNSLRTMLRGQGTLVMGVHLGYADTDMAAAVKGPKLDPMEVARQLVEAIAEGREELLVDPFTRRVKASLPDDLRLLYPDLQRRHDALVSAGPRPTPAA